MNIITIISVAFIVIVFICYLVPVIRLYSFSSKLNKTDDPNDLAKDNKLLAGVNADYDQTKTVEAVGTRKTFHYADEFYNNAEFARCKGINLKHISSAPGVLSGLGVLGTFIGLTLSVINFDSTDSSAIMSSIKNLLGGMGTAFITSLVGMALSALYIFIQKCIYNKFDNAVSVFNKKLDLKNRISADEVIIAENEKTKQEMLQKLQAIQESLIITDEEGGEITTGNMMLNLYEESEKQSQALESFTTDLSNELNASLGKTMNTSIVPLIQNLERSHEAMNTSIEALSNNIQSPATDFVSVAVTELQNSMRTMTNEFRDTISGQTIGQMEAVATNLAKAGDMLNTLPQTMKLMSENVASSFNDVKVIVSGLQAAIAKQQEEMLENSRSVNRTMAEQMRQNFSESSAQQQTVLQNVQSKLEEAVNILTEKLSQTTAGFAQQQEALPKTMQVLTDHVTSSFTEVNGIVSQLQTSIAKQQADLIDNSRSANDQLVEDFKEKFNEMTSFQQAVLGKISEHLDATIHSLTSQLEKAVCSLNEQQSTLSDTHSRSTREIEHLLQSFGQSIANMHNANTESAEMLSSIKKASDNLNGSTDKLQDLADGLGKTSMAVIEQQKESAAKFESIQQQNQEVIDHLKTALDDAQKMVDGYTKDFETIKNGLKEIFKGINDGLKDYSKTLRESTGEALSEYSVAITKSTTGLKNIAEALEESAEELTDGIEKIKRMR